MRSLFLVWTLASVVAWPTASVRADEVDDYARGHREAPHPAWRSRSSRMASSLVERQ
jgi:hypothetical protein